MTAVLSYTCNLFLWATSCSAARAQEAAVDPAKTLEAAMRLCSLCNNPAPRIVEYIGHVHDKDDPFTAQLFSRLFLEHIYAKKWDTITLKETKGVIIHIHPDKQKFGDRLSNEMFQLHKDLLETSDFAGDRRSYLSIIGVYHKIFGWYYHRKIRTTHHPAQAV